MSLQEVSNSVRFADLELDVLARWERERTFQRSVERRAGAPRFVFYDGPPFASGLPHYGHILTSFIKDVVPRYQTMRGYHVPRRWGWDCHGLPVELEAERALGLGSPAAIAEHGIGPFNATCRALVTRYTAEWQQVMARLGRWVDFDAAYRTMDPGYIESVVWCFQALHQRGLVYEGEKVVPYCTRCQTALSNFETRLDDAYRPRVDTAATVAFELAPHEAVLAWTTTPWTLPANAALAVHPELAYTRLERSGDSVWLADAARERYAAELAGHAVRETVPGRALVGRRYQPLDAFAAAFSGAFPGERRVVAADWVSAGDGTGAVHLAPAFGEDDQATCAALGITGPNPVRDDGTFDDRMGELAGVHVFAAGEPILAALARAGRLFARAPHRHDYPHCWRCDAPLIYRSIPSWFVRVTAFKDRLVAHNRDIRWVPSHVGDKRFADWLAGARDWAVSRHRFWGAPVPVWRCDPCRATEVIGSAAELAARGCAVVDWHRPAIDDVTWPCRCGGGVMRRVPDVLDCWFESGAMPFAQDHYPFTRPSARPSDDSAGGQPAAFPGDFIVEYVAQTRGWFYTLLVLSTALFDAPPFRHAVCHGVLLGEDGRKMSKRLRNYPDPTALVAEHGSDALRAALLMSGAVSGNDIRFLGASVKDAVRRLHLPLWNVLHLYTAYALADGFVPTGAREPGRLPRALASETELLRVELEAAMAGYDFARAYAALEDHITALSTWYLRLLKPSLWRPALDAAKRASYEALHGSLAQLARLAAPFLPFLAEQIHAALGGTDSVHLEDWPAPRDAVRDDALVAEMRQLREVVRIARRVREQAGVKHRQPLRAAHVAGLGAALARSRELLAAELNVKAVHELTDVASVVADELVLDYARLGKRLRDRVKPVAAAVRRGDVRALPDGRFEAAGELLAADEVSRRFVARGAAAAAEGGLVVTLDLTVDDALAREGLARELNRAVQDLRKQARLAYADRVVVGVAGASEAVDRMLADHAGWLGEQALATLTRTPLADPLGSAVLEVGDTAVEVSIARA